MVGRIPFLQQVIKPTWRPATGLAGAPLLGVVFGLGWTPCIGPTLGAAIALSLSGGNPWRGVLLLLGVLMVTGVWGYLIRELQGLIGTVTTSV